MNSTTKAKLGFIFYTGMLIITTGLLIYKAFLNPIMFIQAVFLLIMVLIGMWFLAEYVFAGWIAKIIVYILAPYFAAQIINGIETFPDSLSHYPVRAHIGAHQQQNRRR